ncbi:MAG: hypothetical protein Q4F54_05080 [Coriobacteriia bacterium]|nr:hypothetical protein [Coriobacteriia bacterium]
MDYWFAYFAGIEEFDLSALNPWKVTSFVGTYMECVNASSIKFFASGSSSSDKTSVVDMSYAFQDCAKNVVIDFTGLRTVQDKTRFDETFLKCMPSKLIFGET